MIPESATSFWENVKTKAASPFFGTLILVVLFNNWELIFMIFNFDDNYNLQDKIQTIKNHFIGNCKALLGITWIAETFIIIIVSLLLTSATSWILNLFENRVKVFINKKSAPKLLVQKDIYDNLEMQLISIEGRYEKAKLEIIQMKSELTKLETERDRAMNNLIELRISANAKELKNYSNLSDDDKIRVIYEMLKLGNEITSFLYMAKVDTSKTQFDINSNVFKKLNNFDIVKEKNLSYPNTGKTVVLTELGIKVFNCINDDINRKKLNVPIYVLAP